MGILTKDAILAAQDLKTETVAVPEWGGDVLVQTLTGTAKDAFERGCFEDNKNGKVNVRARLAAACVVDEKGNCLFTEQDIEALGRKSVKALDRVFDKAAELNAVAEKDIEAIEKN